MEIPHGTYDPEAEVVDFFPALWNVAPLPGLVGLLLTLYWLLATGRLIPRSSHERELSQQRDRADEWKETALDQRKVNQEIRAQNTMLLESARITDKFYSDVKKNVHEPGGNDVAV